MSDASNAKVLAKRLQRNDNSDILVLTLNKPKALNALDLDMVRLMQAELDKARSDDSISAVFIDSEGEKAFCAGGDIVSMYKAMCESENQDAAPEFLREFFTEEYTLDYSIHTFPKPVIAWGKGIIMGGGLGVFAAADVRIVTEDARVAMPEISIGLFPDVGGSYFLNKMPQHIGMFLGLTGASINAKDASAIGLATDMLSHDAKQAFLSELSELAKLDQDSIKGLISKLNKTHEFVTRDAALLPNIENIQEAMSGKDDLSSIKDALNTLAENSEDKYLKRAMSTFFNGSPITAHLVVEQLKRSQNMPLAECFRMELSMALTCAYNGEFKEGVRALLIDKDNNPKWQFDAIDSVPDDLINRHFTYFSSSEKTSHPLAALESNIGEYNE